MRAFQVEKLSIERIIYLNIFKLLIAACAAKPASETGTGRGYTGPSSVFFNNDYWPITQVAFQNAAFNSHSD